MTDTGQNAVKKKSDLGVRALSAVVMIAVTGGALWLGGRFWVVFVALVAAGVLWEWGGLIGRFQTSLLSKLTWMAGGIFYLLVAAATLISLNSAMTGMAPALAMIGAVVATDTGAYFAGRTFGGPKIAPRISPSKTWAGLFGGILFASLWLFAFNKVIIPQPAIATLHVEMVWSLIGGAFLAIVAQAGDFFESWMKRRAGVKDSGALIPGHGGLFDRVDGLMAVAFVTGLLGQVMGNQM